jgi:hypothetical protein
MKFPFPSYIITTLLTILSLLITWSIARGKIIDDRHKSLLKKLTARGKKVILYLFLSIGLLIFQFINSAEIESNLEYEKIYRDSIIADGIDKANKQLFDKLAAAFKNQNIEIDSLKLNIHTLKGSMINEIQSIQITDPVICLGRGDISHYSNNRGIGKIEYSIASRDAGSTNFDLWGICIVQLSNGKEIYTKKNLLEKSLMLPTNSESPQSITLELPIIDSIVIGFNYIYLNVFGTYSNIKGTQTYSYDEYFIYEDKTKETKNPNGTYRDAIVLKFKKYR